MCVDTTSAANTLCTKLWKKQSSGQRIDYILGWILAIRTSPGHHLSSVAAVNLILKDGWGVLEELCYLEFPEFVENPKIIMMIAIFAW